MPLNKLLTALLLALPLAAGAATVTPLVSTGDTTTSPNISDSFTPAASCTLFCFGAVFDNSEDDPTIGLTNSAGLTFTHITRAGRNTNASYLHAWVSDAQTTAVSQTITITGGADVWTGSNLACYGVDITRTGASAVKQSAVDQNNSAGTTPETIFGAAALTGNPTLGAVANGDAPPAITPPTGWTEDGTHGEESHATPNHGLETVYRNSGFTGTTITWNSTYGSTGSAIAIEVDASSAGGGAATFTAGPTAGTITTTTIPVTFTSDTDGTVRGTVCANGNAGNAAETLAGQCSGGGAAVATIAQAVVATVSDSDTFTALLPGTTYDLGFVIDAATDSTLASIADQTLVSTAFTAGPANDGTTTTTIAVSFTTNIDGTVEGVLCPDGQAAPSAVQVLADQCTGGVGATAHFDEVVVSGVADGETFAGLAASTTYDTHYVIDATVDSGVIGLANQTTSAAGAPTFSSGPTETPTTNGYTVAGTITCTGTCTVEAVACNPGDAAPTSTEIEAGQCGGGNAALMNASEVWTTTVANDFTLTSANKPPRLSVYVSGTDGTTDTAVTSLTSQDRSPRSGFALATFATIAATGLCDLDSYFTPDCAVGDGVEYELATNEDVDCAVSFETDGDFVLTPGGANACDGLRSFEYSIQDVSNATDGLFTSPASLANFTNDDTIYVNDTAPDCDQAPEDEIVVLVEDVAMTAIDLSALGGCLDIDAHLLTYSITGGTLPTGTSLSGTGNVDWTGTPTTENEAGTAITVTVTDPAGATDTFIFTVYVVNTFVVPNCDANTLAECSTEVIVAAPWRASDADISVTGYTCGSGQPFLTVASQSPAAGASAAAFDPINVTLVAAIVPDLTGMTAAEAIAAIEAICP